MWAAGDWSPDDKKLIVFQGISSSKSNSYIYDIEEKSLEKIYEPDHEARFIAISWDQSGEKVLVLSDLGEEFRKFGEFDLKSKILKYITNCISSQ